MTDPTPRRAGPLAGLLAASLLLGLPAPAPAQQADGVAPADPDGGLSQASLEAWAEEWRQARAAVRSADPLLEAESPAERACLAEVSRLRTLITTRTGARPEAGRYAADYARMVADCRAGRFDAAMDGRAEIWAALVLHQYHRS